MPAAGTGYKPEFIAKNLRVDFPRIPDHRKEDIAPCTDSGNGEYKYDHYSLFLSKSRRFPYFTATNIDGKLFKAIGRDEVFDSGNDEWRVDERGREYQHGPHLYSAVKSNFERGHMTKREDPQWGRSRLLAKKAAQSTYYFSNCVPQVKELNSKEWAFLETYILKKEVVADHLKIVVFTGPVLSDSDPEFITKVDGQNVKIPTLFWKVVFFTNDGKVLNKVGFLMGQQTLLEKKGIVKKKTSTLRSLTTEKEKPHFNDFADAQTYQVSLSTIENLSGLKFAEAREPYKDPRPVKLVLKEVEMKASGTRSLTSGNSNETVLAYEGLKLF